jgi:sugar (glycoside-pentoside-hexuronide) transporter
MGVLMDKTKSKHGKARVYLLYGAVPLALATVAMFFAPNLGMGGKVAYAAVTYIIWGMLYTMVNIPYSSLTASLTDVPQERTSLSSIRMIFMLIGVIIISVAVEPIVSFFETPAKGYFNAVVIFAAMSAIFFFLCFKLTAVAKDKKSRSNEAYGVKDVFLLLGKNKQLLIITLASLIGNIAVFVRETSAIYYVTYNMGDKGFLPIFLGVVVVSMLISNLLIPLATKKWDKKGTYIIGAVIGIVGSAVFHFIPFDRVALILIFGAISSFGLAAVSTLGWSMIADTIEYGEWKTGTRAEGISYAIYSFSQKLATAVSAGIVALVLQWTNYVANAEQTVATLNGILSTLTIIPIVFVIASVLVLIPYKIDKNMFEKIIRELKESREANKT